MNDRAIIKRQQSEPAENATPCGENNRPRDGFRWFKAFTTLVANDGQLQLSHTHPR
jgi:hypothetical protein